MRHYNGECILMDIGHKLYFLKGFVYALSYMEYGSLKEFDNVCDEYNYGFMKVLNELEDMGLSINHIETPTEICHRVLNDMVQSDEFDKWYNKEIERLGR